MRSLALRLLISLATLSSQAHAEDDYKFWRHRLGGFDALVLRCETVGVDMLDEVCDRVAVDFNFLAATANIEAIDCTDCAWDDYYSRVSDRGIKFPLEVYVRIASTEDEHFVGGYAEVTARADFEDYLCILKSVCEVIFSTPDVVLSQNFFTYTTGLNSNSPEFLREHIEGYLKTLITRYVKARQEG